ncbi:MarP family serine protease [Leucobacter sp. CSA1]|uniref:MarP family serine protease n=1 Tax=Leucobacter chromiisoli TaxID=2796471 RepID=A0A934Q6P0_9MICO|nr:MarP family serine protease [Leucobacter chromiisoli]MBK0417577.1 MarP family serine protease [Leucobacter chromiisoli]
MSLGLVLDVTVVLVALAAVLAGLSRGFLRTLGAVAGLIAGGAAALICMPLVSAWEPVASWNVAAALLAGLLLVAVGVSIGESVARAIRRPVHRLKLGPLDRLLGGAASLTVTVATVLILAMSAGSLGIPGASQAVASSSILRLLQTHTPEPVLGALSRIRSIVIEDGIPTVLEAAGAGVEAEIPDADAETAALRAASASVPRITANSPGCSALSSGSGFVIGDGLVMTNAHVVAGAREVVVEAPGEFPLSAAVVYFDPDDDIAVLSAEGLGAAALPFSANQAAGTTAFFQGYPYGGPFVSRSAAVVSTGSMAVPDIYGGSSVTRSVTTIAGHVEPGNSGGPLLTADGAVAGMIFARSDTRADVGFALSMEELAPVLAAAPEMRAPVSTGPCA